jgi:hypothetical protein
MYCSYGIPLSCSMISPRMSYAVFEYESTIPGSPGLYCSGVLRGTAADPSG